MQDKRNQPHSTEPVLKRALSHPKRLEILDYLTQKGTGTDETELVDGFGLSAAQVKYHLTILHDADLIAHVEDREHGKTERSYIAAASAGL